MEFRKIDNLKDFRFNPRLFSAVGLIATSLIAAIAISSSANRSIYVWAANSQIAAGNEIKSADIRKTKVFLPQNSKLYFSTEAKLIGSTLLRTVGAGELIPASAVSNEKNVSNKKSVPIKVARNDYPSDLISGSIIDIYSLPARETNSKSASFLIAHGVTIESIDSKNRDISGEIGIVIRLNDESIENFLTETINSKLVVVRSAF
jgi:hypothetical protein